MASWPLARPHEIIPATVTTGPFLRRPDGTRPGTRPPVPGLSDAQVRVYLHAVRHGRLDLHGSAPEVGLTCAEVENASEELRRLRLLSRETGSPTLLKPVHPDDARRLLNEPLKSEIEVRELAIEGNNRMLRQVAEALEHPAARSGFSDGVEVITDPEQAQRHIDAAALHCRTEAVSTHVGAQSDADRLARWAEADLSMLRRGVSRRMLFQHISRTSPGMRTLVRRLAEYRGGVRTTAEGFETMSIFDRRVAFVSLVAEGDDPPGAVRITHHAVVAFLHRGFERLWAGALPFEEAETAQDRASADNRMLLLRLMASGLKDEAIAHRLGMATRTCRRYISALMEELGATSRFQAGMKIAQLGILALEPGLAAEQAHWVNAHPQF